MDYDVVLIHPPSIYDFRKKIIFPGPIAYTVGESTEQFMIPPIGMLSIADYLDRHGYKVVVDNLCERMVSDNKFDAEEHIKNLSARVYSIGLHWCVHSQGAIEVARLCKKLHPEAIVVLGGLTASVFHEEIIQKYEFIDAVMRGEAEKPFVRLMEALKQNKGIGNVPNMTFRNDRGEEVSTPFMEVVDKLDEFEFTRLDLIEPKETIFTSRMPSHWFVPVCRGCVSNCASCGGSAYSYRKYFGRQKPAFRSPKKIVKDIHKLEEQGIKTVFLFQDPRMGGEAYWRSLLSELQKEKFGIINLTMELFRPADDEYIKELAKIKTSITLTISSESGVDGVRKCHGRNYTNDELFKTLISCKRYNIPIGIFSMIALANDTPETIRKTWETWEQICMFSQGERIPVRYSFGPMVLLDPGSRAFDFPEKYGYRMIFENLEDYVRGMSLPAWHQWISYETENMDRESIARLSIDSIEYSISLREKYGLYSRGEVATLREHFVKNNRLVMETINQVMEMDNEAEKQEKLRSLKSYIDNNIPRITYV